jgi:long-chain acyl-CoA synthetase
MQVNQFLETAAQKFPDKQAVWYQNEWMTYGEIERLACRVANHLIDIGVERGDRVALLFENSFNYIINYYAILKAGAVTVALNTETSSDALSYLLNDCGAVAIISQKRFSKHVLPAVMRAPYLKHVLIDQDDLTAYAEIGHCSQTKLGEIYRDGDGREIPARGIDIDLASLVYTSGSTGKPKGVMLSHLNIVSNTCSIVEYLHLQANDRIMVVLPFYYIYGKSLLNTHFYCSASLVIDNRFAFPNVVLDTMQALETTLHFYDSVE